MESKPQQDQSQCWPQAETRGHQHIFQSIFPSLLNYHDIGDNNFSLIYSLLAIHWKNYVRLN